jgi:serine protease Do
MGLTAALMCAPACGQESAYVASSAAVGEQPTTSADLTIPRDAALASAPAVREHSPSGSGEVGQSRTTAIVRAAARVAPAVVSISVIRTQRVQVRTRYESLFMPPGGLRRSAGFGSGVIVRSDGIVLTNDHVITGADQIRVTLPDGRDFDALVIGTDPVSDIAVLRIQGENLPSAPIGTVEGLLIGEWALAIGNPLGNYASDTKPTVTAGVISAVGRNIIPSSEDGTFYFGMIQTDASINPGNSGGPLVNAAGEVIGINASIISRSGGSEGLGFAIPIDRAMRIADDLVRTGEVIRAWVGIDVEPLEADQWGRTHGVRISRVAEGSPGGIAALEPGDRLLAANGRVLTGPLDFEGALLDLRAGDRLTLDIEGRNRPVSLETTSYPSVTAERVTVLRDIQLISVTPQIQVERDLVSEWGALVTAISDRLSRQLGLRKNDVILQINRMRVRTADETAQAFDAVRGTGRVALIFEHDGGRYVREFYWGR